MRYFIIKYINDKHITLAMISQTSTGQMKNYTLNILAELDVLNLVLS